MIFAPFEFTEFPSVQRRLTMRPDSPQFGENHNGLRFPAIARSKGKTPSI